MVPFVHRVYSGALNARRLTVSFSPVSRARVLPRVAPRRYPFFWEGLVSGAGRLYH